MAPKSDSELNRSEGRKGHPKELSKEITRRLRIQNIKLLEQVASMKTRIKEMNTEKAIIGSRLDQMEKLNNALSGGLGSCNVCWGEDPGCKFCAGNGSSGWQKINRRLFNIYVLPTLVKIKGLKEIIQ